MNFKAVLALPKTARSAQTHKSISFIWIVWSTLCVYLWPDPKEYLSFRSISNFYNILTGFALTGYWNWRSHLKARYSLGSSLQPPGTITVQESFKDCTIVTPLSIFLIAQYFYLESHNLWSTYAIRLSRLLISNCFWTIKYLVRLLQFSSNCSGFNGNFAALK